MSTARASRLLLIIGFTLALSGLAGFWLTREAEGESLSEAQKELLGLNEDDFHASFVIAGRDIFYGAGEVEPVYNEAGEITCWRNTGARSVNGVNTDTVIYAALKNDELTLVLVPRDLFVDGRRRINGVYAREGAEGLRRAVAEILDVPIDYYAVINIDIFQRLVDALGGVEVNVPTRMYRRDCAAGLTIDLHPGLQRLNGEQASHFVRYRSLPRGDIDRLDNVKTVAYALLSRARELHIRAIGRLPELLNTYYDEIETNVGAGFLTRELLPRAGRIRMETAGTLPNVEVVRDGAEGVEVDRAGLEEFLANAFDGTARSFAAAPEVQVLLTNRSGVDELEQWYRQRLLALGIPEERLTTRTGEHDGTPTRVMATASSWAEADYYASLLQVGKQQVERFGGQRSRAEVEIVLGPDAYAGPSRQEPDRAER